MHTGRKTGDGTFSLFYRDGWAYLCVNPPAESGKPVYPEEIENRMRILEVPKVRRRTLEEIIDAGEGVPVPLVEWPAGKHLAASFKVEIAEDEMTAWVTVYPPKKGGEPPTRGEIMRELQTAGVVHGIDEVAVGALLAEGQYRVPVAIAFGTPPTHGASRTIRYHFNTNRGKPYLEMEFGRINLKELNFIEHCREDDLLAELLAPVSPVDGTTVTGRVLPAESDTREVHLNAGANTRLSPDRTQLHAAADGNVRLDERGRVVVEPVVKVRNVNYETGNIYFDGSVIVEGHVADGFVVESGGDIQVGKGVGKARLKSARNILLKTGMNGNTEGELDCGGDLFARYLESCSVVCHGNALIEEAIMHSRLTVWKHCVLNGRRSEIIAGSLIVGGSLWCKKLGNFNEARTRVALGVPPEVLLDYRDAKHTLEAKQDELSAAEDNLEKLRRALREGHDDERVTQTVQQLEAAIPELAAELAKLRHSVPELREKLRASRDSMLVVEDTIFRGAVITFGNLEYHVPEKGARKTTLRPGERGLVESGFDIRNKPVLRFEEHKEAASA